MQDKTSLSKPSSVQTSTPMTDFPLPSHTVVQLQSTIGNRAVREMVGRGKGSIQRQLSAKLDTDKANTDVQDVKSLGDLFDINPPELMTAVKTALFAGDLFPDLYKTQYDANSALQTEFRNIINTKIKASKSKTVINTTSGNTAEVARQLLEIISPSITTEYLNKFQHFLTISALGDDEGQAYATFIETVSAKLTSYKSQIGAHDYGEAAQTMRNRVDKLTTDATVLLTRIKTAVTKEESVEVINGIVADMNKFRAELATVEKAWDLHFLEEERGLEDKVETDLAQNEDLGDKYKKGGGTDDGMSVGDKYTSVMACSLYAVLTVKPGWLGAAGPEDLHNILRKTGALREYDDDRVAAKIRYLAGLTPTMVGGENKTVSEYLAAKKEAADKARKPADNIIIDAEGIAHTFAAKWNNGNFVKIDEATPNGGNFSEYKSKRVLTVWK